MPFHSEEPALSEDVAIGPEVAPDIDIHRSLLPPNNVRILNASVSLAAEGAQPVVELSALWRVQIAISPAGIRPDPPHETARGVGLERYVSPTAPLHHIVGGVAAVRLPGCHVG